MNLVALELLKLRTQRSMKVLLGLAIALPAVGWVVALSVLDSTERIGIEPASETAQRAFLGQGSATTFVLIIGLLAITGEYRHRTITASFLATPQRQQVLLAKLAAVEVVAVGYALFLAIMSTAAFLIVVDRVGVPLALTPAEIVLLHLREVVAAALHAALGLGVGALIANQVGALVVVLLAEPIAAELLSALAPEVGRIFPSRVALSFLDRSFATDGFSVLVSGLVLTGYAVLAVAAAIVVTNRRDIA